MRPNFLFSEVITGLRRNVTMTIAMILTTAISLGLLGGGLLVVRLVDRMQELYQAEVEISVELTKDVSAADGNCSQQPCMALQDQLRSNPEVESVRYESRDEAFKRFQEIFAENEQLVKLVRPQSLPASLRVNLKEHAAPTTITQEMQGRPGVDTVVDQRQFIDQVFNVLNGIRNAAFVLALVQAVAAILLISNTIQLSAWTRRTETGIMRLVGATRWRTQMPFLLEAIVTGVIGAALGCVGLVVAKLTFVDSLLSSIFSSGAIPSITMTDVAVVSPILAVAGAAVAAVTGYLTLRLYVRI